MEPRQEDIAEIIAWCEDLKRKRQAVFILERNPFTMKFEWTRNIISIEIDRPLAVAAKTSLVYDSVSKKLYRYINYTWMPLNQPAKQ